MKSHHPTADKLSEAGGAPECGYDAWKRTKIEKGLKQAKDRESMIPVAQILRDFCLQR